MADTVEKLAVPIYLKDWRKKKKWTQEALGHEAGLSTAAIHNLEAGKNGFTDKTLKALADAFGCHPRELLMKPEETLVISGESQIRRLLANIKGLPEDAIGPIWKLISAYVEDDA